MLILVEMWNKYEIWIAKWTALFWSFGVKTKADTQASLKHAATGFGKMLVTRSY